MNMPTPHPIEELDDAAQLMRVSWRKVHNYANNLAKTFLETQKLIETGRFGPDWSHSKWLRVKCGLGHDQLVKLILVYSKLMASGDREEVEAEKERRAKERREKAEERRKDAAAERAAAKIRREAEAKAREQEKLDAAAAKQAAKEAAKAAKKAETARAKAAKKAADKAEAKRQKAEAKAKTKAEAKDGKRLAAGLPALPKLDAAARTEFLAGKIAEIRAGYAEAKQGQETWINGTLRAAKALAEARERFPSNIAFGKWAKSSDLPYSDEDRQALVLMGKYYAETHFILAQTTRRNYQGIWRKEVKPYLLETDRSCIGYGNENPIKNPEAKSEASHAA